MGYCPIEEKIPKASSKELYGWWLNARKTYYAAGGHGKAAANRFVSNLYRQELVKRKDPLADKCTERYDENPDLEKIGVFNGEGAV